MWLEKWPCPPIREQDWKPEKGSPLGSAAEIQHDSSKRSGHSANVASPARAGERLFMVWPFPPFLRRKDLGTPRCKDSEVGDSWRFFWNSSRESYQSRELVTASCCYKCHLSNLGLTFLGQWNWSFSENHSPKKEGAAFSLSSLPSPSPCWAPSQKWQTISRPSKKTRQSHLVRNNRAWWRHSHNSWLWLTSEVAVKPKEITETLKQIQWPRLFSPQGTHK